MRPHHPQQAYSLQVLAETQPLPSLYHIEQASGASTAGIASTVEDTQSMNI
jgi:hypothetical protein